MCNILSIMTHASMPHIIGETFKEVLRGEKCPLQVCVFVLSVYIHTYMYGSHPFISFPFIFAVSCGFSTSFTSSHCPLVWFFFFFFIESLYLFIYYLFIYGCVGSSFLCEGFLQLWQVGAISSSRCTGFSLSRPLLLRSTGSRRAGSVIVAHGPSRSAACGIFPDQGSNPCPLHWQADSQPLRHQGSPHSFDSYLWSLSLYLF